MSINDDIAALELPVILNEPIEVIVCEKCVSPYSASTELTIIIASEYPGHTAAYIENSLPYYETTPPLEEKVATVGNI